MPRNRRPDLLDMTKRQLGDFANELISEYSSAIGEEEFQRDGMNFRAFYENVIYPRYEIRLEEGHDLGDDSNGQPVLGEFVPGENLVRIDRRIGPDSEDPRRTFTLHHEVVGHGALQGAWCRARLAASRPLIPDELVEMEVQANALASLTAAPRVLVRHCINDVFRPTKPFVIKEPCWYWFEFHGIRTRRYVTDAPSLARMIASFIRPRFDGLSVEALGYAVQSTGCVRDIREALRLQRVARPRQVAPRSFGRLLDTAVLAMAG